MRLIKAILQSRMNLELAATEAMLDFAQEIAPEHTCLVPERREELTTEGGLDIIAQFKTIEHAVGRLHAIGSEVSLFIDPDLKQIDAALALGVSTIELHTGCYADANCDTTRILELERIRVAANYAASLDLIVNAGHGLNYHNVALIAKIMVLNELNIGHAIVSRALFCGLKTAIEQMRALMRDARALCIK